MGRQGGLRIIIRVLGLLKPYWKQVILAYSCVFGASFFGLASGLILRAAINRGLDIRLDPDTGMQVALADGSLLWLAGAAIVAAAALRGAFTYGQTYMSQWLSQHVAYELRNRLYDRYQRLSYAFHDQQQTGDLMSRATADVEATRMFVSIGTLRLATVAIMFAMALYVLIRIDVGLTLVVFLVMPAVAYRAIAVSLRLRPIWLSVQEGIARLGTTLQENLSGMRVVKAFARENHEIHKFETQAQELFEQSYSASRVQAFNNPLMTFLLGLAVAGILWYGGRQVIAGSLLLGDLVLFNEYLVRLAMPVRSLGWMANIFSRTASSGQRIFEILDAESAVVEKPDALEMPRIRGHVRFENVSFGYDAASPVLHDVNIEAQPGETIALLGPTGSGKTTIVNLLPRFYDVTAGRVTIDGIDVRDVTLASLRRNIGIVQQDVFIFTATIRDNIRYGNSQATEEDIVRATKIARLHDFVMSLPDGYDTWVGERGITLSGGQRQRLAIARTLLTDPAILIFDDSTSSVDMETEYLIQLALADLMQGRTTFVIAQRLRTVKSADQILVLDHGRIVERGRHEELLALRGTYRQIYDLQLRDQEEAMEVASVTRQGTAEGSS